MTGELKRTDDITKGEQRGEGLYLNLVHAFSGLEKDEDPVKKTKKL